MKTSIRYKLTKVIKGMGFSFKQSNSTAVADMMKELNELKSIDFRIETFPNGDWVAESTNLTGIITGGSKGDDISEMIKDAIFTYYGVPAEYCESKILRAAGEPRKLTQEVAITA